MEPFRLRPTSQQLADHLRRQIQNGNLKGSLPGVQSLVKTLGVNSMAVGHAVEQLEKEGLVIYQGDRRKRLIADVPRPTPTRLKVGILHYNASSRTRHDMLSIRQELMNAGHDVVECPKTMQELNMRISRISKAVSPIETDAWIVGSGSTEILQWFADRDTPALALHGRQMTIDMPGIAIRKLPIIEQLIERLAAEGHRRITLLTPGYRRGSHLGLFEQSFLNYLEANGIPTGPYNLPEWENTPQGLKQVLNSLFQVTPPTALIVSDATMMHSVQLYLASNGMFAPKDISLFCNDFEDSFQWTDPEISHIRWDHRPAVRRVVKWADSIVQNKEDTKRTFIKAHRHEGGTIGPAPK